MNCSFGCFLLVDDKSSYWNHTQRNEHQHDTSCQFEELEACFSPYATHICLSNNMQNYPMYYGYSNQIQYGNPSSHYHSGSQQMMTGSMGYRIHGHETFSPDMSVAYHQIYRDGDINKMTIAKNGGKTGFEVFKLAARVVLMLISLGVIPIWRLAVNKKKTTKTTIHLWTSQKTSCTCFCTLTNNRVSSIKHWTYFFSKILFMRVD